MHMNHSLQASGCSAHLDADLVHAGVHAHENACWSMPASTSTAFVWLESGGRQEHDTLARRRRSRVRERRRPASLPDDLGLSTSVASVGLEGSGNGGPLHRSSPEEEKSAWAAKTCPDYIAQKH